MNTVKLRQLGERGDLAAGSARSRARLPERVERAGSLRCDHYIGSYIAPRTLYHVMVML